jgi:hypothetical protein
MNTAEQLEAVDQIAAVIAAKWDAQWNGNGPVHPARIGGLTRSAAWALVKSGYQLIGPGMVEVTTMGDGTPSYVPGASVAIGDASGRGMVGVEDLRRLLAYEIALDDDDDRAAYDRIVAALR